jgi:hypothetical protein
MYLQEFEGESFGCLGIWVLVCLGVHQNSDHSKSGLRIIIKSLLLLAQNFEVHVSGSIW